MRVEKTSDRQFVVMRGDVNKPQYFSFYIDGDKSSWTKYLSQAHKHATLLAADETMQRIRHRAQVRRDAIKESAASELNPCKD